MSSLGTTFLAAAVALGLSAPAFAQSKMDAGSGPTNGAVSDQRRRQRADFGRDAKDGFDRRRQLQYRDAERRKQRGRHPGPKVDRRLATSHADNEEAVSFSLSKINGAGNNPAPTARLRGTGLPMGAASACRQQDARSGTTGGTSAEER